VFEKQDKIRTDYDKKALEDSNKKIDGDMKK